MTRGVAVRTGTSYTPGHAGGGGARTARERVHGWRLRAMRAGALADCSLVIPTFRRAREVVGLLDRLRALPDPPGEVIVVDGSPEDETQRRTRAWADTAPLPFTLVVLRCPAGLTRQRNVGIDAATGAYVFFFDDDCLPEPGCFGALRRVLHENASGRVGAVAPAILNEMDRPLDFRWRVRLLLGIVPRGSPGSFFPSATSLPHALVVPFTGTRPLEVLAGCAMGFRREVVSAHRFSMFFAGYSQGEDLEYARRIAREWELRWVGEAHVAHHHAPGGRPGGVRKGVMEVRNRYFIWRRYVPRPRWRDRARFWGDVAFIFAWDVAAWAARPAQGWRLAHAAGVLRGAAGCVVRPPRYHEPATPNRYDVMLEDVAPESG